MKYFQTLTAATVVKQQNSDNDDIVAIANSVIASMTIIPVVRLNE